MIDSHGRNIHYLRLSVTERCNLRCRYCMPAEGICKKAHGDMLTEEEMLLAVKVAARLGFDKIRLTGGEPLVKKNIVSLCRGAAQTAGIREVCLTTNGVYLPELAKELKAAGLRRINLSLDSLDEEKYRYITRCGELSAALRGLEAALAAGFEKIKVNCVLLGGVNDDEIERMAALTQEYPVDVRFIELMPMTDGEGLGTRAYLADEAVLARLPQLLPEPEDGGVAKLYRLPHAKGNIGLISPISAHFCAGCNRLRLTADGKLKPCLHSAAEYPLKGLDAEGIARQFEAAILAKPAWHGELSAAAPSRAGRSMNQIGG